MNFNEEESKIIAEIVSDLTQKNKVINKVIREDVFTELEKFCTVLYYPLNDDNIEGCHKKKQINGKTEQFVFINTNKEVTEQVFTAAHELGHIWEVDKLFKMRVADEKKYDAETIIGRFAAELLMPKKIFINETIVKLSQLGCMGDKIKIITLLELIAYLMNYFCVPFKAIILRFNECGMFDEKNNKDILKYDKTEDFKIIVEKNQYTRINRHKESTAMKDINIMLREAEENGNFTPQKLRKIKELFKLNEEGKDLQGEIKGLNLGENHGKI